MKNIGVLIACLLSVLLIGSAGGFFTAPEIPNWYATIIKPSFNPPNWIFGPVWTVLYLCMGYALYLIILQPASSHKNKALLLFAIQLFLNFWWSIIFFNFHAIGWALVEIIAMWAAIFFTIQAFYRLNKRAAYILIPYLLWVSFATFLNYSIWVLNK